jgi:hypothetical protein
MTGFDQVPLDTAQTFADNPEPRCPCLLLLDVSGSMRGQPIAELNAGLTTFKDELMADALAAKVAATTRARVRCIPLVTRIAFSFR